MDVSGRLLLRTREIHAINCLTKRYWNILTHSSKSLTQSESEWVCYLDVLAALAQDAEGGWINGFLRDSMRKISNPIMNVFFQCVGL